MKIMIIISFLLSLLYAQDYSKKDFAAKAMELGWNYEKCAFGSSNIHINGNWAAMELATQRAVSNVVINNCSKKKITFQNYKNSTITKTTVRSSAKISYKILLQGKVEGKYVSAICATKPIQCTK
jgi:septal ring-binding cell division protein DamX